MKLNENSLAEMHAQPREVIRDFQTQLMEAGYNPGPIDGILGSKTKAAFSSWLLSQTTSPSVLNELTDAERRELQGVHPDMVKVTLRTKETCSVPFVIFDGIRTAQEQNRHYTRKASTKDGYRKISKHQVQPNTGMGHAVDLVPLVKGRPDWDWDLIYVIAEHMVGAARELDVDLRWGGCWQHVNPLSGAPENWVSAYVKRKLNAGKRAFNDGPHWELYRY